MAPRRKRPVPVVLNPTEGSKFKEETILVSLTETNISVVVVGKTGRGLRSRYPRKTLVNLDVTSVEYINSLFEEVPDKKTPKTAAAKNGRKQTAKKPGPKPKKVAAKKVGKKPGPKPKKVVAKKVGKKPGPKPKKVAEKKATTRKKPGPKPKKANGAKGKRAAAPKKTTKKPETVPTPKRTRKVSTTTTTTTTAPDPWGDEEWG